jgi:uracil-DNA glycosylase
MQKCQPYLLEELALLTEVRVVVALGKIGWDAYLRARRAAGLPLPRPLPRFGHAARSIMPDGMVLLGSFHPSQQNTFTGKLTRPMLQQVFSLARRLAATGGRGVSPGRPPRRGRRPARAKARGAPRPRETQ